MGVINLHCQDRAQLHNCPHIDSLVRILYHEDSRFRLGARRADGLWAYLDSEFPTETTPLPLPLQQRGHRVEGVLLTTTHHFDDFGRNLLADFLRDTTHLGCPGRQKPHLPHRLCTHHVVQHPMQTPPTPLSVLVPAVPSSITATGSVDSSLIGAVQYPNSMSPFAAGLVSHKPAYLNCCSLLMALPTFGLEIIWYTYHKICPCRLFL